MKIQQAIRILANTRIIIEPAYKPDGGEKMVCISNFEPPAINEAFQEIIKWWINQEKDITGGET